MKPQAYEIACDKCNGSNIDWSEFEHLIWCYDCKIDTRGTEGVFGGPIPVEAAQMFGMSFDRIDLKTKQLLKMTIQKNRIIWQKERRRR